MKKIISLTIVYLFITLNTVYGVDNAPLTPEKALQSLMEGNKRYINNQSTHPNRSEERRNEIASGQSPYAIIVACADSRVAPEIIFDQGLGDLFVVRVAGNVLGSIEIDSAEYSAIYLNSSVILILGHSNCGAVDAVLKNQTQDIEAVAALIEPAVKKVKKAHEDPSLEKCIKMNALDMKALIENVPSIKKLINNKKIQVHAAYYDLNTGRVELLEK